MICNLTDLSIWMFEQGLLESQGDIPSAILKLERERDLAQKNFEHYFKQLLRASGRTMTEAEEEWEEEMKRQGHST